MERCTRCGCFFIGNTDVCANCSSLDNNDKAKLANYCENNSFSSYEELLYGTGIASSNLSRFLSMPGFNSISKKLKKGGIENL